MSEVGPAKAFSPSAGKQAGDARFKVSRVLMDACRQQLSGTLKVTGNPGGSFRLRHGSVVEMVSPGAPGVDTLLLRSGRISDADWASVVQSGVPDSRFGAELADRGLVGAAELQLICRMAALDGTVATGMGKIDGYTFDHESPAYRLAAPEGIDPDWLLQEASWRIRALRALDMPISVFHDRLVRTEAGSAALNDAATGERLGILLAADGRRSARDLAFRLGRSLYAVTLEVSRMLREGLVAVASSRNGESVAIAAVTGGRRPVAARRTAAAPDATPAATSELPTRRPGASGILAKHRSADEGR